MTDLAHGNVECGLGLSKTRWHMHAVDVAEHDHDDGVVVDEDDDYEDANDFISPVFFFNLYADDPVKAFAEGHDDDLDIDGCDDDNNGNL